MPVPTTFADLSTTIASNSPAGGDNVFPDLDNYIRALAGMLASVYANTATNGWTSPYLPHASAAVFNEAGADIDFRAEGDTDANLLFLDAGNDRVGIGTATPATKVEVSGSSAIARVTGTAGSAPRLELSSAGIVNWSLRSNYSSSASELGIYQDTTERVRVGSTGKVTVNAPDSGYGLNIPTGTPASAAATGTAGDIAWDASYIYVCTATNTWKRAALSTW